MYAVIGDLFIKQKKRLKNNKTFNNLYNANNDLILYTSLTSMLQLHLACNHKL